MNGHVDFSKSENNFAIMGESPPSKYMAHCTYTAATNAMKMIGDLLIIMEQLALQY
jgi:hypothetical protein